MLTGQCVLQEESNKSFLVFEQGEYALYSGANERDINNIFEEYEFVRNATVTLFIELSDKAIAKIRDS